MWRIQTENSHYELFSKFLRHFSSLSGPNNKITKLFPTILNQNPSLNTITQVAHPLNQFLCKNKATDSSGFETFHNYTWTENCTLHIEAKLFRLLYNEKRVYEVKERLVFYFTPVVSCIQLTTPHDAQCRHTRPMLPRNHNKSTTF